MIQNKVESLGAQVFFHKLPKVDVAMMKLPMSVKQGTGIPFATEQMGFSEQVLFYGFPLNNLGTIAFGMKYPLVKRASLSGVLNDGNVSVMILDGTNNHGFSGGPVIKYEQGKKAIAVVGLISGYLPEESAVKLKNSNTDFIFSENSGLIISYGAHYMREILSENK